MNLNSSKWLSAVFRAVGGLSPVLFMCFISKGLVAQYAGAAMPEDSAVRHLFLDVHQFEPGKVTPKDVAAAHKKDLAVQEKYGVQMLKYWVDQKDGRVYCLASGPDSNALRKTHAEAHGLLPDQIFEVTPGQEAAMKNRKNLYLDFHLLGPGKVTPEAVAAAHKKDLAIQKKYGVNFIDYWVDSQQGVVMCLAEASDSTALIMTHREAHGLVPDRVMKVKQGN